MRPEQRWIAVWLAAGVWLASAACAPLRIDADRHIRGTIVAVRSHALDIRHKTGPTYEVALTADTKIVNDQHPEDVSLCAGQRATVYLADGEVFTAAQVTVRGGRCP
jgi:hypothetical protein